MRLSQDSLKPIYIQIAEGIEDDILAGILNEGKSAYSQYQIAKEFNINPATAAKGINILVNDNILFKKRGLGMFVSEGAKEKIKKKRKDSFYSEYLDTFLKEARKIGLSKKEIIKMVDNNWEEVTK